MREEGSVPHLKPTSWALSGLSSLKVAFNVAAEAVTSVVSPVVRVTVAGPVIGADSSLVLL